MQRSRDVMPAGAGLFEAGVFSGKDEIAEGEGVGVMLERIEQGKQVKRVGGEAGLIEQRLARHHAWCRLVQQAHLAHQAALALQPGDTGPGPIHAIFNRRAVEPGEQAAAEDPDRGAARQAAVQSTAALGHAPRRRPQREGL